MRSSSCPIRNLLSCACIESACTPQQWYPLREDAFDSNQVKAQGTEPPIIGWSYSSSTWRHRDSGEYHTFEKRPCWPATVARATPCTLFVPTSQHSPQQQCVSSLWKPYCSLPDFWIGSTERRPLPSQYWWLKPLERCHPDRKSGVGSVTNQNLHLHNPRCSIMRGIHEKATVKR